MSTALALKQETQALTNAQAFTPEQMKLIRDTIARNASPDELQLFLYRAKVLGLDPLKTGQIHFVKYGTGPGSVVIGIEGFRAFAHRSKMMSGIERGVKRDEKSGKILYGWCRVHRKDWQHPAYEEVSFAEYDTGRNNWLKMPETMIKKVAEASALRMAFPNDLGGVYSEEEMEKVAQTGGPINPACEGQPENHNDDGVYRFPFGATMKDVQLKGLDMDRMHSKIGSDGIEDLVMKFDRILSGQETTRMVMTEQRKADLKEFIEVAEAFLKGVNGSGGDFVDSDTFNGRLKAEQLAAER